MKSKKLFLRLAAVFTLVLVVGVGSAGAVPPDKPLQSITCGTIYTCTTPNPAFFVDQTGGGDAIRARSNSRRGTSRAAVRGIGRYNAVGVLGESQFGIGAYGTSGDWHGVYGQSTSANFADNGVYGYTESANDATEAGVRGYNVGIGAGVHGTGIGTDTGYGVRATSSDAHAVYADSNSATYGHYGGWFTGPQGVYATSEAIGSDAITAECTAGGACFGLDSSSTTSNAIYANTGRADSNYGLLTYDNIYSLNYHAASGFSLVAQNGGDADLEVGDLVAVNGIAESISGSNVPLLSVQRADAASAAGAVGVVESAYSIEMVSRPDVVFHETEIPNLEGGEPDVQWLPETVESEVPVHSAVEGPVKPGGLMLVKVQGLAQVKVNASAGAIQVGDMVTAGAEGRAAKAQQVAVEGAAPSYLGGTIVGKALEPLAEGKGRIWVLVDLQ